MRHRLSGALRACCPPTCPSSADLCDGGGSLRGRWPEREIGGVSELGRRRIFPHLVFFFSVGVPENDRKDQPGDEHRAWCRFPWRPGLPRPVSGENQSRGSKGLKPQNQEKTCATGWVFGPHGGRPGLKQVSEGGSEEEEGGASRWKQYGEVSGNGY